MAPPPLRVLVVDDDPAFRSLVTSLVREAGHEVVGEAADGAEATRLAGELRPDTITMDLDMPVLDGVEAIQRIGDDAAIVVVSGSPSAELLCAALDGGARWHLAKREVVEQLPCVLAALAEARRAA